MGKWSNDPLHAYKNYGVPESNLPFGLPELKFQTIAATDVPQLVCCGQLSPKVKRELDKKNCWVHFFTDDYMFEKYWNNPFGGLKTLQEFGGAIMPDFSTYPDWPTAVNLWQVYRANWLARFWQENGVKVVPIISQILSKHYTTEVVLSGTPKGMPVCTMYYPSFSDDLKQWFYKGLREAIDFLRPPWVMVYGSGSVSWSRVYHNLPIPEYLPTLYYAPAVRLHTFRKYGFAATSKPVEL